MNPTTHYFYNGEIYEFENKPGKGYQFGTDFMEESTLIPLTESQCEFHRKHPEASTLEVWNTTLTENHEPAYDMPYPADQHAG